MIDTARDELIRLRQVARHFDVSYQTVLKWVVAGKLEATRVGGSWRTTEAAIRSFSERATQEEIDRLRSATPLLPAARKAIDRKNAAVQSQEHLHYTAMFRAEGFNV